MCLLIFVLFTDWSADPLDYRSSPFVSLCECRPAWRPGAAFPDPGMCDVSWLQPWRAAPTPSRSGKYNCYTLWYIFNVFPLGNVTPPSFHRRHVMYCCYLSVLVPSRSPMDPVFFGLEYLNKPNIRILFHCSVLRPKFRTTV